MRETTVDRRNKSGDDNKGGPAMTRRETGEKCGAGGGAYSVTIHIRHLH